MKDFNDYSFEELLEFKGMIYKSHKGSLVYIDDVFFEDNEYMFTLIYNREDLRIVDAFAEIVFPYINPLSLNEIGDEKYLEFIEKLEKEGKTKFLVFSE